ncbi:MAG: hypothetical protein EOP61_03360 [Sphingomonadales bacterium]|nr:MAG: hypothetical protein EOP61_03360 [Sphingomonadales bacterium]
MVLDRSSRTATVYIFNQGQAAATFDITLVDRVMLPDGQIRSVEQAQGSSGGQALVAKLVSAHDLVLATPRRVTLAPGKGQMIRLRAVPPASGGLAIEYRTHLTVTNVPPPETGLTAAAAASQAPNQLSFQIRSVFGLSIPVIIRTAPAEPHARLEQPRLTQLQARATPDGPLAPVPAIEFEVAREGRSSVFGNIEVRSGDRAEQPLAIARGIGVYPEIDRRHFSLQLRRAPKPGETLTIVFTDDDARPGTELARIAFKVP